MSEQKKKEYMQEEQFMLPNVRLDYANGLFRASKFKKDDDDKPEKFSVTFIFDNAKHGAFLDKLEARCEELALQRWKTKRFVLKLNDGNLKADRDGYGDGTSFISASNVLRPWVVGKDAKTPVVEEDKLFYSGCRVNAVVGLNANDATNSFYFRLLGVQFYGDDECISGPKAVNGQGMFQPVDEDGGSSAPSGGSHRSQRSVKPQGAPANTATAQSGGDDY